MQLNDTEMRMAKFFTDREGNGILNCIKDINFLSEGIIDSLDMVSLAVFIEKTFGKKIDLADSNTLDAVQRFDSLMKLVQ